MTFHPGIVWLALPAAAYALGSIPWGLILTRTFTGADIRSAGSGNIGATNVRRTAGNVPGLLTLALDVLKGWLPTFLALLLAGRGNTAGDLGVSATALAAFLGHLFPLYMKGRSGGKGVATAAGCILAVSPAALGLSLAGFLLAVAASRRVSAGSLAGAALLPLGLWVFTASPLFTALGAVMAAGILIRHAGNIRRLLSGREPRL